jgi:uncharacterized protein YndB with AHSA1/START domain
MAVKPDANGRRSIELNFELPGTPEQVWQAIATGPGISSWFVPSTVEEKEGGAVGFDLGGGASSVGRVTVWKPPYHFAYEERDWSGAAPPLATEFFVEARSGGICNVRLVHSLFASTAEWDDQLESMESGWPPFFQVLRIYLTHYPGQRAVSVRLLGNHPTSEADALEALIQGLGLKNSAIGARCDTSIAGAPRLRGIVERIGRDTRNRGILLRLEEPTSGAASFVPGKWGGKVVVAVDLYFYGDNADSVARKHKPLWQEWVTKHFPLIPIVQAGAA